MGEITLKSGKVITVDVSDLTVKEWRDFINPKGKIEDEDSVVAKCSKLTVDEVGEITQLDFRRIVKEIVKQIREPLADPNSQSASTSTEQTEPEK